MREYLNKEEIKQWRSSLEKITLEEFASRLGKLVPESRPTNDLVDMVMNGTTSSSINTQERDERLSDIAQRAFQRERQLSHTPFSFRAPVENKKETSQEVKKESTELVNRIIKKQEEEKTAVKPIAEEKDALREEVDIILKKNLTDREQVLFDYFINNRNKTVYAKDLAELLDLPRDYIYKYIKNLRAKIEGDKLKNADRGGFILQ